MRDFLTDGGKNRINFRLAGFEFAEGSAGKPFRRGRPVAEGTAQSAVRRESGKLSGTCRRHTAFVANSNVNF